MESPDLTPEERGMAEMWDRHTAAEFEHGSRRGGMVVGISHTPKRSQEPLR